MSPTEPPAGGVFDSLRRLCDGSLALLQNRLELFAVEAQEEKARLVRTLALAAAVYFLAGVAAVMVTISIVALTPRPARVPVPVALSIVYVLATAGAYFDLR